MAKIVVSLSFDTLEEAASLVKALKEDRLVMVSPSEYLTVGETVQAEVLRPYDGWTY